MTFVSLEQIVLFILGSHSFIKEVSIKEWSEAVVEVIRNEHEISDLKVRVHTAAWVSWDDELTTKESSNISDEVVIEWSVAFKVVDSSSKGDHIFISDLSKDEISSMTNGCRDREVRDLSVLDDSSIGKGVCDLFVATTEDDSDIKLACSKSLLNVIACLFYCI